jgi:hypothetical protein
MRYLVFTLVWLSFSSSLYAQRSFDPLQPVPPAKWPFNLLSGPAVPNSHEDLPGSFDGDILNWLKNRNSAIPKSVDLDQIKKLMNQVSGADPESLKRFLDAFPQLKETQKFDQILGQAQKLLGDPNLNLKQPEWQPEQLKQQFEQLKKQIPSMPSFENNPTEQFAPLGNKKLITPEPKKLNREADQLTKTLRKSLGDSAALQGLIKDLSSVKPGENKSDLFSKLIPQDDAAVKSMIRDLQKDASKFGRNLSGLMSKMELPRMGDKLPNFSINSPSMNGSMPSFSTADISFGGIFWFILLILGLFVVAYFWKSRIDFTRKERERKLKMKVLSPIDAINAVEDIIPAYEWLSVSKLGDPSYFSNHRKLEQDLDILLPDYQKQIRLLADAYEVMRYAPSESRNPSAIDLPRVQSAFASLRGNS